MPHIYREVMKLEKQAKVGDMECVTLVKHYTDLSWTGSWREGAKVVGNRSIAQGTAIGTFVDGKWPAKGTGNHSGFYGRSRTEFTLWINGRT